MSYMSFIFLEIKQFYAFRSTNQNCTRSVLYINLRSLASFSLSSSFYFRPLVAAYSVVARNFGGVLRAAERNVVSQCYNDATRFYSRAISRERDHAGRPR